MTDETDTDTAVVDDDDARLEAEFGSGFAGVETKKPANGKADPDVATQEAEPAPAPEPEYAKITAQDWIEHLRTLKTQQKQLEKAHGTIGSMTKLLNGLKEKVDPPEVPPKPRVEVSAAQFAEMEEVHPELAKMNREGLGRVLTELGLGVTNIDEAKVKAIVAEDHKQATAAKEMENLTEEFPDWKEIVGAVTDGKYDPNQPYRQWLATKGQEYQDKINNSVSAFVVGRSIGLFQRETEAATAAEEAAARGRRLRGDPQPSPKDAARSARIQASVQPRGDTPGPAAAAKTDDDEFLAGFAGR